MSIKVNTVIVGKVSGISKFGAFVDIEGGYKGMVHISEVSKSYLEDISTLLKVGDEIKAKVISIADDGKVSLSMKDFDVLNETEIAKAETNNSSVADQIFNENKPIDEAFENMMTKFRRDSQDKMADLKRSENRGYSRKKGRR